MTTISAMIVSVMTVSVVTKSVVTKSTAAPTGAGGEAAVQLIRGISDDYISDD